jgi:sortase A
MISASHEEKRRGRARVAVLRVVSAVLMVAGALALGYVAYVVVSAHRFQASESRKLQQTAAQPGIPSEARIVTEGDVIGQIEVPRLGMSAIVVQGDSDDILRRAVGHVPETALPGQAGNVALAGHRDTIFRPLRDVQVGDTVTLKTPAGNHTYQVSSTEVVPPTDVGVLESRGQNELTLITCFPFHFIGHAPNRFIVRAREIAE